MTRQPDRFRQHCVNGIRNFVQTAVVIDDEAYLETTEGPANGEEPRRAEKPSASVLTPGPNPAVVPGNSEASEKEGTPAENAVLGSSPTTLNAKVLADAFHYLEIVCGIYKPDSGDEPVSLATKAARHADIVVIDWLLDSSKTSGKAKDIVKSILRSDSLEHGRLRLIAIYTGESNLRTLADDLLAEMNKDEEISSAGAFRQSKSGFALVRSDSKVCFFNKPDTLGGDPANLVAVSDLPSRLVYEFSEITEGLLANFAVSAIAAIRRSAHHIAAYFGKNWMGRTLPTEAACLSQTTRRHLPPNSLPTSLAA